MKSLLAEEQILTLNDLNVASCPFCGDTHISATQKYTSGKYFLSHGFSIGCQTINCIGCHTYGRLYETKEEAITAWNKRAEERKAVKPLFNERMNHFVCKNCSLVLDEGRDNYCPSCGAEIAWSEYYIDEEDRW